MDPEIAATSEIKSKIADTDLLMAYINERDKEPIWDGSIFAYKDKRKSNDDLIGRAPVQVKEKKASSLKNKTIKFSISINNLKQYRNEGGVLYFVVCINSDKQKKIYYASLLPFLINQYITVSHNKKNISVTLKELPEKTMDIENVVINFIRESQNQDASKKGKNWTIDELIELLGKDNIRMKCDFTCMGYDRNDPFSYMKDNELYLYVESQDGKLKFPVARLENAEMETHEIDAVVGANGKSYICRCRIGRHRDGSVELLISKGLRHITKDGVSSFKYDMCGNLDERIKSLEILMHVIDGGSVDINGVKLYIKPTRAQISKAKKNDYRGMLNALRNIKKVLDKLRIKTPLEMENITEKQDEYIRMLIRTILYGEEVSFVEKGNIPPVGSLEIGNLHIMLSFRQLPNERYIVKNFFDDSFNCKLDTEGDYETSQFCILRCENYLEMSNIDVDAIKRDFKRFNNIGNNERLTLCILEMIKAYDIDNSLGDLLELAEDLIGWLMEVEPGSSVHIINLYQCIARKRALSDEELITLNSIYSANENLSIKASAQILLGNMKLAQIHINSMSDDEKRVYVGYPIYKLLKG